MSNYVQGLVWETDFPTQSQLLVALKLADHANNDGTSVFPARRTLADLAQCSETTAKDVLRAFREVGLLLVLKPGGNGPGDTTHYQLNVPLLEALAGGACAFEGNCASLALVWSDEAVAKGANFDPFAVPRGQSGRKKGANQPKKGAASRPQTSIKNLQDIETARTGACEASASPARAEPSPEPPAPEAYARLREALRAELGEAAFLSWCRGWRYRAMDDRHLVVEEASAYCRRWADGEPKVERAVVTVLGPGVRLKLVPPMRSVTGGRAA